MPYSVNVNNFSTPFSTQASIIGARNEERRLERVYGDSSRPRMSQAEQLQAWTQDIIRREKHDAHQLSHLATSRSSANISFGGRSYTLPPVRSQNYSLIAEHGDFDAHFGGLGVSKSMVEWKRALDRQIIDQNIDAHAYNDAAEKKARGGLFKKRSSPPVLLPILRTAEAVEILNHKFAAARIAVRLDISSGNATTFVHPSSESGDLLKEMSIWSRQHWSGIPFKPWQNDVLLLPELPTTSPITQKDADNVARAWNDFRLKAM